MFSTTLEKILISDSLKYNNFDEGHESFMHRYNKVLVFKTYL